MEQFSKIVTCLITSAQAAYQAMFTCCNVVILAMIVFWCWTNVGHWITSIVFGLPAIIVFAIVFDDLYNNFDLIIEGDGEELM